MRTAVAATGAGLAADGAVERRVFVHATPRDGLGDAPRPGRDGRPLPRAPARSRRAGLAGRRDDALGQRPARPAARRRPGREPRGPARFALPGAGHGVRLRQRVELAARAGRRRDQGHPRRHIRTVRSMDRDPRAPWSGLAGQPGGGAPACPEGAGRGGPASLEPRHVSRGPARIGDPGEPVEVPFRGLRRNARALAGGLVLLLGIAFLLPDLSSAADPATGRRAAARRDRRVPPQRPRRDGARTSARGHSPDRAPARRSTVTSRARPARRTCRATRSATRSSSTPRRSRTARSSRSPTCTGSRRWPCCWRSSRSP